MGAGPPDTFLARVADATRGERWAIDGGYSKTRPPIWEHADTVIWLDYPMHVLLGRWARRTVARIRSGEEFWPGTGNRESVRNALRRDGLLVWILPTHRCRRRTMAAQLEAQPHLRWVHLRSPAETDRWLASL